MKRKPWGIAGLLVTVLVAGAASAAGKRVDVGGHRLRLLCAGRGSPTIVLESGLGDPLEVWSAIRPALARTTRVCAYDRAGLGRSESGPLPRDGDRVVAELRTLLRGAGVAPPWLLVGHSLGGLHVQRFAREHPAQVAGLVLVDPTPPGFPAREAAGRTEAQQRRLETVLALSPPAMQHELDAVRASIEQLDAAGPLPDVPILVVSAGRPEEPPEFRRAWLAMQVELAQRLGAEQMIAGQSGHYVQFDEPELLVRAIRELLAPRER